MSYPFYHIDDLLDAKNIHGWRRQVIHWLLDGSSDALRQALVALTREVK